MTSSLRSISRSLSALLLIAFATLCNGQSSQPAQPAAETLHVGTELVIVNVVVEDKSGHPVHGLTRDNFVITEQNKPQTVRNFEEHTATTSQKPAPPSPKLPPGEFTDYTPVAPDSTLNILLVDALNTPQTDQIYLRQQLLDFIKREKPGTSVAIFGLANRLVMLQGFTADPAILRTAVQHLDIKGSPLLLDPAGTGVGPQTIWEATQEHVQGNGGDDGSGSGQGGGSSPGGGSSQGGGTNQSGGTSQVAQAIANLKQWEAEQAALKTHMRSQFTLDAFNSLAHYLSNFPGRKNLIWFSGSFPLQIEPDTSIKDPFGVTADSNQELRETTNLLAAAQTAVYPVDARGLITAPAFDPSQSGRRISPKATDFTKDVLKFGQSEADEHITMETMANDTGGHAFYNTNGLTDAVASAIDAGSNYYTLTYTPTDHKWNTAYRNIHVEIAGSAAAKSGKLAYRHGYYADDPRRAAKLKHGDTQTRDTPGAPMTGAPADNARAAYSRAVISSGSPTPQDIVFKVRVLPLTGKNEDTLAPDNQPDPRGRMKGPYRTFAVDYVALPGGFSMAAQSDGRHTGTIEFGVFVYDADGNLLNVSDKQVSLNLPPDTYSDFRSNPVRLQLQVSAPVKQESFLRLIVHDVPSDHYGAVEIPTAEVGRLPPLEAHDTAVKGAAAPNTKATPQPTRKQ